MDFDLLACHWSGPTPLYIFVLLCLHFLLVGSIVVIVNSFVFLGRPLCLAYFTQRCAFFSRSVPYGSLI